MSESLEILIIKLDAGQDVTVGLTQAVRNAGWKHAIVLSAMGSVSDATLIYQEDDGQKIMNVAGPALEIAAISGIVSSNNRLGMEGGSLSGIVCDQHGNSFGGRLMEGKNMVFITIEAVLQRLPDV